MDGAKIYVTDNDNYIVDLYFEQPIKDAKQAAKEVGWGGAPRRWRQTPAPARVTTLGLSLTNPAILKPPLMPVTYACHSQAPTHAILLLNNIQKRSATWWAWWSTASSST